MLKEAQNPKYQAIAFFIDHFKKLPDGLEYDDLFPEQQYFLMFLTALAPSKESIQRHAYYENEKEVINSTEYVTQPGNILKLRAKKDGITVDELRNRENRAMRKNKIAELEEKLGLRKKEDSSRQELKERYEKVTEKLQSKDDMQKKTLDTLLSKEPFKK